FYGKSGDLQCCKNPRKPMSAARNAPIVITMGDPSGVGPEVTVKALASLPPAQRNSFRIVGDAGVLERALSACGIVLGLAQEGDGGSEALQVRHVPVEGLPDRFGVLSPRCGEAAYRYIRTAVEMAQAGEAAGIVTAPINKEALNAAGHHY